MDCYGPLSFWYDSLTGDVPYDSFAEYYESLFRADGGEFSLIADLCCGTGTIACLMAQKGYDVIGIDASEDMLSVAMQKASEAGLSPLFICQNAEELDLYGTVDAAYSSLDSINYLPPELLPEVFRRLHLFIRPGGLFVFDIRSPEWLRSLDGSTSVDEQEGLLCLCRTDYDEDDASVTYGIDIFSRSGKLWQRSCEEHTEYVHEPEALTALLLSAGFEDISISSTGPQGEFGRLFFSCRRSSR